MADAEQLAEKVQTESLSRAQAIRRMLDEEQAMRQQVLEQYLAQLRDVCAPQSGADTALTAAEQENGMEDPMQESETSEQKTEAPCTALETAEHEPEAPCAAPQVPAVEQEETAEEPNEDETAVPTQDGARSVQGRAGEWLDFAAGVRGESVTLTLTCADEDVRIEEIALRVRREDRV